MHSAIVVAALLVVLAAGCSGGPGNPPDPGATAGATAGADGRSTGATRFPDVLEAELRAEGAGSYSLEVTLSSEYDTPQRYADGWRVLAPDGTELGTMTLTHDHATEQPFTRTQTGLEIPADVATVVVEGRDLANGYGGATVEIEVPEAG